MSAAPQQEIQKDSGSALVQMARASAYDRYIQALLVKPKHLRTDFLILAAFHGELARIPVLVREPMMGEIRLQWWQDAVAATEFMAADAAPDFGSPLANHVADLIARFPTAREEFLRAINARRAELDVDAFAHPSDFETYLDGVGSTLLRVGFEVLGADEDATATEALRAAGHAVGCADVALRLPRLAALGRLPNFSAEPRHVETPELDWSHQMSQAIEALEHHALTSVKAYRTLQSSLSTQMTQAVLPLALVEPYFKALQGKRNNPLQSENPKSPLARFFRLWWAARHQRI